MPKVVRMIFKEDGSVETDTTGFVGKECAKVTDEMMKALNGKVSNRVWKAEAHQVERQQVKTHG